MPKSYDLIAFDWDGTLMDSTASIAQSIQAACEDLQLPVPTFEQASHVIGLGLTDALAYAVPSLTVELMPRMLERYRVHYLSRDGELKLFPQVFEMLSALKQAGHYVAVATGKNRVGLDRVMAATGLTGQFDATRTADESRSKPHPQMLFDLIDRLGVPASRTLMVGDTTHDLKMAENAGVDAVAVTYGAHSDQELATFKPRASLKSSSELRHWLADHA